MNKLRQGFSAGIAFAVIFVDVAVVIGSHGESSSDAVSWTDIIWFLVLMAVFASASIDLYKYWQLRKEEKETWR